MCVKSSWTHFISQACRVHFSHYAAIQNILYFCNILLNLPRWNNYYVFSLLMSVWQGLWRRVECVYWDSKRNCIAVHRKVFLKQLKLCLALPFLASRWWQCFTVLLCFFSSMKHLTHIWSFVNKPVKGKLKLEILILITIQHFSWHLTTCSSMLTNSL